MSARTRRLVALLLVMVLLLAGCGSLNFSSAEAPEIITTDGSTLGDRTPWCTANPDLAAELRAAIEREENVTIQGWDTEVIAACLDELMEEPELFWFRGYHITATTGLRTTAEITFTWLYEDGPAKYQALCAKSDEVLQYAPVWDDYALALYLYEWLERNVTYAENEGYDQTAYAAICEGSAVCGGIADAFAFLLHRAGREACTVTGDAWQDGEKSTHAWNYAVLDGAVYGFDPTWDNTDMYDANGVEYQAHDWFALTSEQMNTAHTPNTANAITATANADNYYIRQNCLITEDSMDAVYNAIQPQFAAGSNCLTFRCASRTVFDTVCFRLFDLQEISSVLRRMGAIGYGNYTLTYTQQPDLFSVTIYL